MRGTIQKILGQGDNVAGNKILNFIIKVSPFTIVLIIISATLIQVDNPRKILGMDRVFKQNDSAFNILVLSFYNECKGTANHEVGVVITNRLKGLKNTTSGINFNTVFLDEENINGDFDATNAYRLLDYHNADMVIYGNYNAPDCAIDDLGEICYNWITSTEWDLSKLQASKSSSTKCISVSNKDLRRGVSQESTDFIVHWIEGLTLYNQKKYKEAEEKFKALIDQPLVESGNLVKKAIDAILICKAVQRKDGEVLIMVDSLFLSTYLTSATPIDSVRFLTTIGNTYNQIGRYSTADFYSEKALSTLRDNKINSAKHEIEYSNVYASLQGIKDNLDDYSTSIDYGHAALHSIVQGRKTEYLQASIMGNLGLSHSSLGNRDSSEFYRLAAIDIWERTEPIDSFQLSIAYLNYVTHLITHHRNDTTKLKSGFSYLDEALKIEIKNTSSTNIRSAALYNQYAVLYDYLGEYHNALHYHRKAYDIKSSQPVVDSFDLQLTLNNLSVTYYRLGDIGSAVDYSLESLKILHRNYPQQHEDVAKVNHTLSVVLYESGCKSEAIDYFIEANKIAESYLPSKNPITLAIKRSGAIRFDTPVK